MDLPSGRHCADTGISDDDEEKKRSIISKIEDRIWKRRTAGRFSFSSVGGLNTRWGRFLQRMSEIFCQQLIFAEVWAYRDFLLNSALTSLHG